MGTFQVTPRTLTDTSPSFYQGSQTVQDFQTGFSTAIQNLLNDMSFVSELNHFANSLSTFHKNLNSTLSCAQKGLTQLGLALDVAATEFTGNEMTLAQNFEVIGGEPVPYTPAHPGTNQPQPSNPGSNPPPPVVPEPPGIEPIGP
jgi:hypothetical protein